jgi:glutathione S-transferase
MSPFSEKVRRILSYKKIAFHAVRAPAVMPKPDLVALTGGYRRIPVLQMGNHVYCDTALIARVLERIQPQPTLYPSALADVVAEWADGTLFGAVAPIGMQPTRFDELLKLLTQDELANMAQDRARMHTDGRRAFLPVSVARTQLPSYLQRIDDQLAGAEYLLGTAPCIADFSVYHCLWFLQTLVPEQLEPFANIQRWMERIRSIPTVEGDPIPSSEALEICRQAGHREAPVSGHFEASPSAHPPAETEQGPRSALPSELRPGQRVCIRATDYGRDPVEGELVTVTDRELVLRREDARAGQVIVHFPCVGYELHAA